ncbi:MAG: DUF3168 domain-containing protein [Bacteroidales bacterium]|nr:DUF3168 domain-containing protein [Bacteroidales bacterium]
MSLLIGLYMKEALGGSDRLAAMTGGRIYPVIAPLDGPAGFPYIVFASDGMEEASDKDGLHSDTQTVEVMCYGKDIDQTEAVAEAVRRAMAKAWPEWNGRDDVPFEIADQGMRASAEDYDLNHDGYYLPLVFTIETAPRGEE